MKRYVIERHIPNAGQMTPDELSLAALHSHQVLKGLGSDIEWVHSYVTDDKLFCVYLAKSPELIRRHAQISGFPADVISEVSSVLDPSHAA
ncbi:hypothetical protein D9M68_879590 [compost metagenome]